MFDDRVRAGVDRLGHALVLALDRRRQTHGLEGARAGVATDEPDDLRAIAPRTVEGADHETDRFARRDAERVLVAEHARHRHGHEGGPFTRDRAPATPGR